MSPRSGSCYCWIHIRPLVWVRPLVAALLLATLQSSCLAHEGHAALPSKGLTVSGNQLLLSAGARKAIDLRTAKVTLADLAQVVECHARVELPWSQQALVTTHIPGRITEVFSRPGETVYAGQELARMESLELETLQLELLQADTELSLAREQSDRRRALAAEGVIAGREAFLSASSLQQRKVERDVAMCKLRAVGLEKGLLDEILASRKPLSSFAIAAPLDGLVASVDVRPGQQIQTSEHLFHIADLSTIWIIGEVLERDVERVHLGQKATFSLAKSSEPSVKGTIEHMRLRMDETRHTRAVTMRVRNPDRILRPGMFGRMAVRVAESREAIICPQDGILTEKDSNYVLVNRGEGIYVRQPVRLGIRCRDGVEILDGLFPGDQVVTRGNYVLCSLFGSSSPTTVSADAASRVRRSESPRAPAAASTGPTARTVIVQGVVELPTDRKVFASSRLEGRVKRISVQQGQAVQAGDTLAEVESLPLRNVQAQLFDTLARLTWTSQRVRLLSDLVQSNVTSRNEFLRLQADEKVLGAKKDSLVRTLALMGVSDDQVDRLVDTAAASEDCDVNFVQSVAIRASVDGIVARFNLVPGQLIDPQTTLFELQATNTVWVKGHLFQSDALGVQPGRRVRVMFAAFPGEATEGAVVRISPVLASSQRVLPFWVEVDNPDGRLIEGMWARIEIETEPVPLTASARPTKTAPSVTVSRLQTQP